MNMSEPNGLSFIKTLQRKSFRDKILFVHFDVNSQRLPCSVCSNSNQSVCNHLEKCSECTMYQIDKTLRCYQCCLLLLGYFPDPCTSNCVRNQVTHNVSARCEICSSALRKKCMTCMKQKNLLDAKTKLKNKIAIFIINRGYDSSLVRPCSHCIVCTMCNSTLIKGHREKPICGSCRTLKKNNKKQQSELIHNESNLIPQPIISKGSLKYILNEENSTIFPLTHNSVKRINIFNGPPLRDCRMNMNFNFRV